MYQSRMTASLYTSHTDRERESSAWSGATPDTSRHEPDMGSLIIEYWMDNWTVSDVTGHTGVIGQYLAKAIISDKSK